MKSVWLPLILASVATLAFGVATGLLVGLSNSPTANVLIPILFSIIGGSTGFYFAKHDLKSDFGRLSIAILSVASIFVSLGTSVGVFWGMDIRVSPESWSLLDKHPTVIFPESSVGNNDMEWVLLDARLYSLGLGVDERKIIIERLHASHKELDWKRLVSDFESICNDMQYQAEWNLLLGKLQFAKLQVKNKSFDSPSFNQVIEEILSSFDLIQDDDDDMEYIQGNDERGLLIFSMVSRLRTISNEISEGESVAKKANALISNMVGENIFQFNKQPSRGIAWENFFEEPGTRG